jgi:hypothetical protein
MPNFFGFTLGQVDAFLGGGPNTIGIDRHYAVDPPRGTIGPPSGGDLVMSQAPAAGTCSETSLNSTLFLTLP